MLEPEPFGVGLFCYLLAQTMKRQRSNIWPVKAEPGIDKIIGRILLPVHIS
jgi:hypothetical protein